MTEKQANDMTVGEMFKGLDEYGAGFAKLITRKENDEPLTVAILVQGERMGEVLEVVEALERRWDEEENR